MTTRLVLNRRQHRRGRVSAVAAVYPPGGALGVALVRNVSVGGACLIGGPSMIPGIRIQILFHLAGQSPVEVTGRVLRRQIAARHAECAISFENITEEQQAIIAQALEAEDDPENPISDTTLVVVARTSPKVTAMIQELEALGHKPRLIASPLEAAAWLHDQTTAVLVEDKLMQVDGWNFMQFLRDSWPAAKRLAIATDVHSFRLNFALRAGMVDGVVEKPFHGPLFGRKVGEPASAQKKKRRAG